MKNSQERYNSCEKLTDLYNYKIKCLNIKIRKEPELEEGRILAIDYGEVRIGLAISDPLRIFAFPLMVIDLRKTTDFIKTIQEIIKEKE
ncbi:MAG: RuvX/YqgF family protein, partial [Candidatus Hydrogenedens sp.]